MTHDSSNRTVVIVRHAQAGHAATDHARPLTGQGRADARAAGEWIAGQLGDVPQESVQALVSTADRARQTWAEIGVAVPAQVQVLDGLYEAQARAVIETLLTLDDSVRVALVVGHNPSAQDTVEQLGDGSGSAHEQLRRDGFPTAAVAVLEHTGSWHDLAAARCHFTAVRVARG